ncbi:uncharacterized protein YkwD [Aeromicrobium panaciterrae]|uniref:Uncharacterized protein YkwD n=1 Tax=Aeromicrobium panaciterrae TaxID=363861 RepID=A0ABU1UN82_9ACTN|nr:CAP domain-containing protein [Aeromicrobium panaciterrae]MDR7086641.1 uncharacterized protein YkwD [Aeromicrobium panaciterrae]
MKIQTVVTSAALAVSLLVALPSPVTATTEPTASDVYEAAVITYTNRHRVNHDRVKLRSRECVERYAESWAAWMAANQTMKHQSMTKILNDCDLKLVGENIAYGYSSGKSVVSAWMNSTGHRRNILKSGYRQIGVGAVQDKDGRWWVSQVFGTRR